jgi:hypothetical protein
MGGQITTLQARVGGLNEETRKAVLLGSGRMSRTVGSFAILAVLATALSTTADVRPGSRSSSHAGSQA